MPLRKSSVYFISLLFLALSFSALFLHERTGQSAEIASLNAMSTLVHDLGLTDLCLFTEASYTRHVTQTDLRTPFQEFPMSLEHFPTGSLILPPR